MSIQFQCSQCGREFDVLEQMAGTRARCNTCGNIVTVPFGDEPVLSGDLLEVIDDPLVAVPTSPFATGYVPGKPGVIGDSEGFPPAVKIAIGVGGGAAALLVIVLIASSIFGGGSDRGVAESTGPAPTRDETTPSRGTPPVPPPAVKPQASPPQPNPQPTFPPPNFPSRGVPSPPFGGGPVPSGGSVPPGGPPDLQPDAAEPAPSEDLASNRPSVPSPFDPPDDSTSATPLVPNLADRASSSDRRPGVRPPGSRFGSDESDDASSEFLLWEADVDGSSQAIEYKKGKLSIPVPSMASIVFPNRLSNFVLITGRDEQRRTVGRVFDLRSGKEIGKPVMFEDNERPSVFSTDGRYVASPLQVGRESRIGIRSFVTGELAQLLDIGTRSPAYQDFAAAHQYVTIEGSFREWVICRWDLNTGQQNTEFVIGNMDQRPLQGSALLTPGGRYLSLIEGSRLSVYQMDDGRCVGRSPLPFQPKRCLANAFSQDGVRLAAILDSPTGMRLVCWDFTSGEIRVDHTFDSSINLGFYGGYLQWVPDENALLYSGRLLLDGESGADVWTFPEDRRHRRLMLGLDRMLTVTSVPRSGDVLATVDLPKKDLDTVFETVRSGGTAIDTVLPQLVKANWLTARPVSVPSGFTDWSAVADPWGALKKPFDRELLVATEQETIRTLAFAAPPSGQIAVQKNARRASGAGRSAASANLIERYDLDSGRKSRDIPLPNVYEMLDISPSGDHVLVGFRQSDGGFDRLDVIAFSPSKHVTGWRPYEAETRETSRGQQNPKHVSLARFLDDHQVLTVNSAGKLAVWALPDCQAVYYIDDFGQPAAFSPGRKYVVGVHNEQIRIFDTATGECRGDLPTPATGAKLSRAAFRPDGLELAALVEGRLDKALARWDLQSGKLEHEFPLPSDIVQRSYFRQTGQFAWRGDRYLLLDNQYLIDLKNRAVVWKYHVPHSMLVASESPDGRNWYCVSREAAPTGPKFLVGRPAPSESARLKADFATLERQLVLGPGMSVRLDVQLSSVGSGDLTGTVQRVVTETLENRGIKVDSSAPLTLRITSQSGTTGSELGVSSSRLPLASPDQVFAQQRLSCVMSLRDSSGKERWSHQQSVDMRSFGGVQAGEAQSQLTKEMQDNFTHMLSSGQFLDSGLSTYVFGKVDEIVAGESQLTFGGEGPPPPPPKPTSGQF